MASQPRSRAMSDNQEASDLLRALLEAPPLRHMQLPPATLHSVDTQREHALRGFLRRTWVDRLLKSVELVLMLTALAIFMFWLVDGPVRDWLYLRQHPGMSVARPFVTAAPAGVVPSARVVVPTASSAATQTVPLPFVSQALADAPLSDDFIVPGQVVPAAPRGVAPQPSRLLIPAIELDTPVKEVFVVDGVWEVAEYAAGYLHGTALPGDRGNTALAGHAGLRGAVFRDLGRLSQGDDVYLEAGGWRYQYRVRGAESVWPTQVEVLVPTETAVLTLITCTNWDTQRLVVIADLIGAQPSAGA